MQFDEGTLTPEEQLTVTSYNSTAHAWAEAHSTEDFWREELEAFGRHLPTGTVLEIGCGGGRDAEALINLGYDYVGTDAAPNFVEVAKARNPQGSFEVSSVHNLPFEHDSFDGFWASAVLLHISKDRINPALKRLHEVTKSNGIGFIAIKEGQGEHIKEEVSTDGNPYNRFWAFYSDDEFRGRLAESGLDVLEFMYKPMSERTKWLIYLVKVVKE